MKSGVGWVERLKRIPVEDNRGAAFANAVSQIVGVKPNMQSDLTLYYSNTVLHQRSNSCIISLS